MTFDATETMHARARVTTNLRVAPRRASERRERASRVRSAATRDASDAELDRRAMLGLSTAALVSTFAPLSAIAAKEEKAKKVVAVPYTKYVVQKESTEEAIAVAKELKEAGVRLYGAFWCENCNKQKELLGKEAMEYIDYVECFPDGVYQNSPGHEDVIKPDAICKGYSDAWPLWVVPKGDDEIGIQGQIKKPRELKRLIKEARGEKGDLLKYFTTLEMD